MVVFLFFQKTQDFPRDYENLSRLGVYLYHVLQDENNTVYGENGEHAEPMIDMIRDITAILSDLRKAMKTVVNSDTVPFTAEDVMPEKFKSIENRADRFMRDYVIFHKAENFGKVLYQQYRKLCETHRTQDFLIIE